MMKVLLAEEQKARVAASAAAALRLSLCGQYGNKDLPSEEYFRLVDKLDQAEAIADARYDTLRDLRTAIYWDETESRRNYTRMHDSWIKYYSLSHALNAKMSGVA